MAQLAEIIDNRFDKRWNQIFQEYGRAVTGIPPLYGKNAPRRYEQSGARLANERAAEAYALRSHLHWLVARRMSKVCKHGNPLYYQDVSCQWCEQEAAQ